MSYIVSPRVSPSALNVRCKAAGDILGVLPAGTPLKVLKREGDWYTVEALIDKSPIRCVLSASWVDEVGVEPIPTSTIYNHNGWHVLEGAPKDKLVEQLRLLHDAKRPMPILKLGFIPQNGQLTRFAMTCKEAKAISPNTVLVARLFDGTDYAASDVGGWNKADRNLGRQYFEQHKWMITPDLLYADYIEWFNLNETGIGTGFNAFYEGLLDGLEAFNRVNRVWVRLLTHNFSTGNPGLPGELREDAWYWVHVTTQNLLRRMLDMDCALGLHGYAYNGDWIEEPKGGMHNFSMWRHDHVYDALPSDVRDDLLLILSEFGESHLSGAKSGRSPVEYGQRFRATNIKFDKLKWKKVLACWWTLGNTGPSDGNLPGSWARDRLEVTMDEYLRFAMETKQSV